MVLTLVTVTGSRPKTEKILLKEIVQSVNGILNAKEVVGIEKEWDDEVIHTHTLGLIKLSSTGSSPVFT